MIYKPKEALIQFPSLWLPGSPLPSSRGLARRCCCACNPCGSSTLPDSWSAVIDGVENSPDGEYCDDPCIEGDETHPNGVNDTWILDEYDPSDCTWSYTFAEPWECTPEHPIFSPWSLVKIVLSLTPSQVTPPAAEPIDMLYDLSFINPDGFKFLKWSNSILGTDYSTACSLVDKSLSPDIFGGFGFCYINDSTCLITAL